MKYPVGIQYFPDLIEGGYAYVDKTRYIKMLEDSGKYYFLSRPRRFGKSLFVSTLEARFQGRRELFRGLAIDTESTDWTPRPVIKLSLNSVDPKTEDSLVEYLDDTFSSYEKQYGKEEDLKTLAARFENILKKAFETKGRKVAVLIDEYDAPLLSTLEKDTLNESYRETLKSVFSVLKPCDQYIHFAFVTGVSRFSHTSLFSGTNHLEDISLFDDYAGICGITEAELRKDLLPGVGEFAAALSMTEEETLTRLKENYDGYHFSPVSPDIYNPFSLLLALKNRKISNYWFESGTPDYLLKALRRDDFYLPDIDCLETVESGLSATESYLGNPVALLYETGYVTIKEYAEEAMVYTLGLPNKEVSISFAEALLPLYSSRGSEYCKNSFAKMRKAVMGWDADAFMRHLQIFLEGNPYGNTELKKRETYFKNNIFIVLKGLGFMPRAEEQTCSGRMDVMLRTRRFIYIFELKTDGSVAKGEAQIEDRCYAMPYGDEGRRIIKIAANYSSERNNIDSWRIWE